MFSKSLLKTVSVSTLSVLAISQAANAALTVDLRFPAGPNSPDAHTYNIPSAGDLTPITIQAWAQVTGPGAAEDGLQGLFAALRSNNVTPGITGGITAGGVVSGWGGSGASSGSASNLSTDGIGDWGNTTNTPVTVTAAMGYFHPRTVKATNNPIDWGDGDSPQALGVGRNDLANGGTEFLVGTFTFTPLTAAGGSVLQYSPASPAGGFAAVANWWEDTADKTIGSPSGSKTVTSGTFGPITPNANNINAVTINVLPEPTSLGFLGLGALGVLRRRRA